MSRFHYELTCSSTTHRQVRRIPSHLQVVNNPKSEGLSLQYTESLGYLKTMSDKPYYVNHGTE